MNLSRLELMSVKCEQALARIPLVRLSLWVSLFAVAWSVAFFSPRFGNWTRGYPYSWETFRGAQFLMQTVDPWRRDVEPAMHWRLLPPLVAHSLGLKKERALVIPWAGVLALLGATFVGLVVQGVSRCRAVLVVLALCVSGGALTPIHWLGINDAWAWFGLVVVTCGRGRLSLILPVLLFPWVDERFLIGLPLAVIARCTIAPSEAAGATGRRAMAWALAATVPYLATRLVLSRFVLNDGTGNLALFTWQEAGRWLPLAPQAWWMSGRAAWLFILAWLLLASRREGRAWTVIPSVALTATIVITACLAHDLTRSTGVAWPAIMAGAILLRGHTRPWITLIFPGVAVLNALLPTGHIVNQWVLWIWPFG